MNSVTAPSLARASVTNFATSAVRSVKPAPDVGTVSSEETMEVAVTDEAAVREREFGDVMNNLSTRRPCLVRNCARAQGRQIEAAASNLAAVDVPLQPVRHLDQSTPRPLHE